MPEWIIGLWEHQLHQWVNSLRRKWVKMAPYLLPPSLFSYFLLTIWHKMAAFFGHDVQHEVSALEPATISEILPSSGCVNVEFVSTTKICLNNQNIFSHSTKWEKIFATGVTDKTAWRVYRKLRKERLYDPTVPRLCVFPMEIKSVCQGDMSTPWFRAAVFTTPWKWKLLRFHQTMNG